MFPIYCGIPDFRTVGGYEQGTWQEEANLLPRMLAKFDEVDLHGLLEEMLAGLEGRDAKRRQDLRAYFVDDLAARARHRVRVIELMTTAASTSFNPALEVGCRAGATLFEWARRGPAVGIDPNLLIAKKHAQTLKVPGLRQAIRSLQPGFEVVAHKCEAKA